MTIFSHFSSFFFFFLIYLLSIDRLIIIIFKNIFPKKNIQKNLLFTKNRNFKLTDFLKKILFKKLGYN